MASQSMDTLARRIGVRVAEIRTSRDQTQREVAAVVGVDTLAVSRWERGVTRPTDANLAALSVWADRPMEWFMAPLLGHAREAA